MNEPLLQAAVRAHRAGNTAEAARLYSEILRLDPRQFLALYGLGVLHYQSGNLQQAERLMAEAARINPSASEAFFTRGCALQRLNRPTEALICFDHVIKIKPDAADAYGNRGVVLMTLNKHAEALDSMKTALALDPSNAANWNNHGCILNNLARYDEAIACFDAALSRQPRFPQALINRGSANAALKRYAAATTDFAQVLSLDPNAFYVAGNLAHFRLQSSDWRHYEQDRAAVAEGVRAGRRVVMPFIHLGLSDSPGEQLQCASIWTAHELPVQAPPLWRGERYQHDRIRVAYVSADFHSHATAELMAGVWERHDRSRFETFAISFGRDDQSPMRARVAKSFDRFIDVKAKSDYEIAVLLRQFEIDIAIDLKGYTKENRAAIFAHRPCPVQASYLGYPGTMGAVFMDYLIADEIVIPPEHRAFYAERIVHLPSPYQCNTARPAAADPRDRQYWGLPATGFVFCCFNNAFKITPGMFALWMRLLNAVSGSVLWLLEDNPESAANLRREARAAGVSADRLVFAPRIPLDQHLARHVHADLFLDTEPYGAHTTASDALWAGLPVLTVAGPTFASRVAASLLHAAGVPELVTADLPSYEAAALQLARDPEALKHIRAKLLRNRDAAPLFDTERFTRNFESALRAMWQRSQNGSPPDHFRVQDTAELPMLTPARSRSSDSVSEDGSGGGESTVPQKAIAHLQQAQALRRAGRNTEALAALDDAIALAPQFASALVERGALLGDLKRYSESSADFEKALAIEPDRPYLRGNFILSRLRSCDWRDLDQIRADVSHRLARGERVLPPFAEIALSPSPADQLKCARIWAAHEAPPAPPLWTGEAYRHDKIRIAWVSGDFHAHATAALMAGVFEHHDRSRFDPVAISYGPDDGSDLRARVKSAFEQFIDVQDRSDAEIAALLRQLEIDIAVDLKGYTENGRTRIFAQRPAPVQVSYLGYPGTMAAPYIDYLIADEVVIPPEHHAFYSEKIVTLPGSYQCNDSRRPIVGPTPSRAELGLPEDAFVFCCFNGNYKIMPDVFGVWMQLLHEIPGSVLWLLDDNADAAGNLRREAEARGINASRLIFAPKLDVSPHLARHRAADLFLDTQPVGAHTTASDALWAGLPLLTMLGSAFAGRVAASLLHAIGVPELVTQSLDEYRDLALRLARDPARLRALRDKIAQNRQTHPLFDTAAFTRSLEAAFAAMHERQQRREPPASFAVAAAAAASPHAPAPIPDAAAAAFMRGCRTARENDLSGALKHFDEAIFLAPQFGEALINRGAVLLALNQPEEALASLDAAVAANSAMAEAWTNRGNALCSLGRFAEGISSFDRVLVLRPRQIETLINRGTALLALRRPAEALESYDRAIEVDGHNGAALHGRANALFELKRFEEAVEAYQASAALSPTSDVAGILAFARLQCCDWRNLEHDRRILSDAHLHAGRLVDPFQYLAISQSPADQKRCAELWTTAKYPARPTPLWNGEEYRHDKIRVAWLSADFRAHPVALAMAGVWRHSNREQFENVALSWGGDDESEFRHGIMRNFHDFRNIEEQTDTHVARLLRDMEIDIAIDLMGYTANCRPGILAARPAPVQVSFLGFAGTMGAPFIDYLIADAIAVADGERGNFTENVIHLPGSYFPIDNARRIAPAPSRSEAGLPEKGFVFASFNNSYKFTPEMFDIWMRLLRQIDGSVLWLSHANTAAMRNLQREAELRGVNSGRLIFAPFLPEPERHLARLSLADLFLDTLPYNAHATAADALFAGLPLLTCRGTTFAGRVAASLLHAAGLAELVTGSLHDYEALALALARDADRLRAIRQQLAHNRKTQPLFDTAAYAARFESALVELRNASAPRSFFSTA